MNQRNPDSNSDPERGDNSGNFYTGSETFFGVFTQAQVYLSGVRLVHDGKVTQQVSDLASQIENNRRRFLHSGDVNFALQELTRITNSYNQRVQAWESEASRRERNKKTMSGGALAKMKSELSMVRTKTRLASRTLTKLEVELHQISGRETSESNQRNSDVGQNDHLDDENVTDEDPTLHSPKPVLSAAEQVQASEFLNDVDRFLKQVVGHSLSVAIESADREVVDDPDQMEQVWDAPSGSRIPVFLAACWTVKHPSNLVGTKRERKKLDLSLWLIPKSLSASHRMRLIDGEVALWISSRKLDSARIDFQIAAESESPKSEFVVGFLEKFTKNYGGESPTLLVARFHNLEWTQKTVAVSCSASHNG